MKPLKPLYLEPLKDRLVIRQGNKKIAIAWEHVEEMVRGMRECQAKIKKP